jgi:putative ABC transport system permease protein
MTGIRPSVLLRASASGIARQRSRSLLTVAVVAVAVAAAVGTVGRTDAARTSILARLEDPSARFVRIIDSGGSTPISPDAVRRISSLSSVMWAIGLSSAGPLGYNPSVGGFAQGFARDPVGTRTYWGDLLVTGTASLADGRAPNVEEALAGAAAARDLGLADGVGEVLDENRGPVAVVGTAAIPAWAEALNHYVLIRGGDVGGSVAEIDMLAQTSADVDPLIARVPDLLGVDDAHSISVDRATQLLDLRNALANDVGDLDVAILLGSISTSALLVAAILYGAIAERRREFGLRRTQGATRTTIGALVVIEALTLAMIGATVGSIIGETIVLMQAGALPDPGLSFAIAIVTCLASAVGAMPAALLAAYREPLVVLRSA